MYDVNEPSASIGCRTENQRQKFSPEVDAKLESEPQERFYKSVAQYH